MKKGALVMGWMKEINEFIEKHRAHPAFGPAIAQLEKAKNILVNVSMHFAKVAAGGDRLYPMLHACLYLEMFGETELAYLLLHQAIIAKDKVDAIFQKAGAATSGSAGQGRGGQRRCRLLHRKDPCGRVFREQHPAPGPGKILHDPEREQKRADDSGNGLLNQFGKFFNL